MMLRRAVTRSTQSRLCRALSDTVEIYRLSSPMGPWRSSDVARKSSRKTCSKPTTREWEEGLYQTHTDRCSKLLWRSSSMTTGLLMNSLTWWFAVLPKLMLRAGLSAHSLVFKWSNQLERWLKQTRQKSKFKLCPKSITNISSRWWRKDVETLTCQDNFSQQRWSHRLLARRLPTSINLLCRGRRKRSVLEAAGRTGPPWWTPLNPRPTQTDRLRSLHKVNLQSNRGRKD